MRRTVAVSISMLLMLGGLGVLPAQATHGCMGPDCGPINVIIVEGVGRVCNAVSGLDQDLWDELKAHILGGVTKANLATTCTPNMADPTWVSKPVSQWNPNPKQGLYWPGVGPGMDGSFVLSIARTPQDAGANLCVDLGGPGCESFSQGWLKDGASTVGAHCGSSSSPAVSRYTSTDRTIQTKNVLEWIQSAATILPLRGQIISEVRNGVSKTFPASARPTLVGFTSSRGVGGSGNCGIQDPTTGFQTEGMLVTF